RHPGLVGQVRGDGEAGDAAPALGAANLIAGARMRGHARTAGRVRLALALLALALLLGGVLARLVGLLAHPALLWLITRPTLASASRWRSNTKWMSRCRSSLAISSN